MTSHCMISPDKYICLIYLKLSFSRKLFFGLVFALFYLGLWSSFGLLAAQQFNSSQVQHFGITLLVLGVGFYHDIDYCLIFLKD